MCQKAEGMAACGMQQQHIAAALGMGESTYYEKQALYPEFAEAIKRGRAKGIALVTKALMDKAKNMDTASIIFYLKCQAGWREQPQQVAFTDPDGKPVAAPTMADFVAAMAAIKGSRGED